MNIYRKEKGNILLTIILLICIVTVVAFFFYLIVFKDMLGILSERNPIDTVSLNTVMTGDLSDTANEFQENEIHLSLGELENKENAETEAALHYYYQQLDQYAKVIYKKMEDNKEQMKTGTYKMNFGTQFNDLLNQQNGEKLLNIAFQSAWNAYTYDQVDVFYIDVTKLILTTQTTSIGNLSTHRVFLANAENESYLSKEFLSPEFLKKENEHISNLRNQVIKILEGYDEYEKIKYLHDWMIDNIEYDTTYKKDNIYNLHGALRNGKAVCEGYARAFKYMLDGLDIPCVLVSGIATNSSGETESHAWNYVQLNGKWYAIDLTWDDPVITGGGSLSKEARYKYFLKGSNSFLKNHKEDGNLSDNSIKFKFPKLEKEDYTKWN